jgi:hypothetical protein
MMKLIAFATSLFITNSHARAGDSMNTTIKKKGINEGGK